MTTLMARTGFNPGTTLRWVASGPHYSIYDDPDGERVYLRHGDARVLVPFEDLNLEELWGEFRRWGIGQGFVSWVTDLTYERWEAQARVRFCAECQAVVDGLDLTPINPHQQVCSACDAICNACDRCGHRFMELSPVSNGTSVCQGCGDDLSWCESCEILYDPHTASHEHGECYCEPLGVTFKIRNDGDEPLASGTRTVVTLPKGVISDEGIDAIRVSILGSQWYYEEDAPRDLIRALCADIGQGHLGRQWQAKQGNFTKRLSRHAYNTYALSVPPDVISQVGNVAREHSTELAFEIDVTRDLNLPPEHFVHEESCWWGGETQSRCALKTNGGFALRAFGDPTWDGDPAVEGRAWVMPLRRTESGRMTPTFNTETPDAFVVFNGYGTLGGYVAARVLAHMAGMTYRKIGFSCSPMWVNSESGYLVAPEEIAKSYTDSNLSLSVSAHASLYDVEREKETADVA